MKTLIFILLSIPCVAQGVSAAIQGVDVHYAGAYSDGSFANLVIESAMKPTYGVFEKIPYVFYDNPNSRTLVVITQGVGEYATSFLVSDLPNSKINAAGTYATYASKGKIYPFDILVAQSYKSPTASQPAQTYLMASLTALIKSFSPTKVIGTGYSYGGQLMLGFYLNSIIGGKNAFIGNEIFDGYVIMDAKAPGTPDWCKNDKPSILICATGGLYYYPLKNVQRDKEKYCPTEQSPVFYSIAGGTHATSWLHGYDESTVEGKAVMDFIKSFEVVPPPIQCTSELDTLNMQATFYTSTDTLKFKIIK